MTSKQIKIKLLIDKRKKVIVDVLLFFTVILYYTIYYNYGISLSDEGYFFNTTLRIMDGQLPYIDFRYYPPALNYLLAIILKVFGVNLLYERLMWVVIISACVVMTLKLSKGLMPFPFYILPPLLYLIVPGPWHKSIIPFLFLCAALVGKSYINKGNTIRWAFYCGLLSGASIYFRYDTGGFIFMAFLCLIAVSNFLKRPFKDNVIKKWLRETGYCALGLIVAALPAMIYSIYLQTRMGFLDDLFRRIVSERGTMGLPFPRLDMAILIADPKGFLNASLFYLPPLILISVFWVLVRRYYHRSLNNEGLLVFLLLLIGLFSYNQTIVRTDFGHLLQSVQIPYILGIYLIWKAYHFIVERTQQNWKQYFFKITLIIGTIITCVTYIYLNIDRSEFYGGTIGIMKNRTTRLGLPMADVYVEPGQAQEINEVVNFIKENSRPGEPILVLPYEPMYYFLTGRDNPTYFDAVFPSTLAGGERKTSFLKKMRETGVNLIVYSDDQFTKDERSRFSVYDSEILDYIKSNYKLVKIIGKRQMYLRQRSQ